MSTPAIPDELRERAIQQAASYLDGQDLPDVAERRTMETALAFERARLSAELEDIQARLATIQAAFWREGEALQARIDNTDRVLEELLRQRIREGGENAKKSLRIPGAGTLSLRKSGGRWSVKDADAALEWLRAKEFNLDAYTKRVLVKSVLLDSREDLMREAGGEWIAGLALSLEGESFSFKPEGGQL